MTTKDPFLSSPSSCDHGCQTVCAQTGTQVSDGRCVFQTDRHVGDLEEEVETLINPCAAVSPFGTMRETDQSIPDGSQHPQLLEECCMVIHQKLRNLKVYLSDAELQTLQIASSMSLFETQGDFIAASILDSADKEMEAWRYTTTTQNPNALEA